MLVLLTGLLSAQAQIPPDSLLLWLKSDQGVFADPFCSVPVALNQEGSLAASEQEAGCWMSVAAPEIAIRTKGLARTQFRPGQADSLNAMPFLTFDGSGGMGSDAITALDFTMLTTFVVINSDVTGTSLSISEPGYLNEEILHRGNRLLYVNETGTQGACFDRQSNQYTIRGHQTSQQIQPFTIQTGTFGPDGNTVGFRMVGSPSTERIQTVEEYCGVPSNPYGPTPLSVVERTLQVGERATGAQPLTGHVAEIIAYRGRHLDDARMTVIENYLGARYNIQLFNDVYEGDAPEYGDLDFDVSGIAEAFTSRLAAGYSAGLILEAPADSLPPDTYFLMAGHRTAGGGSSRINLPEEVQERTERVWYIDKTGTLDATLGFDFERGTTSPAGDAYVLLYKSDLGGIFNQTDHIPVIEPGRIVFHIAEASLTDGYYTLGTRDAIASPLPELPTSFIPSPAPAATSFEVKEGAKGNLHFSHPYPNPFKHNTTFELRLASPQHVQITVYDMLGRAVASLHDGMLENPMQTFVLDGNSLPGGLYFIRLNAETAHATQKVLLIR